jgi:hypothetical protein
MESLAVIDKMDFANGFASWHIEWPIKNLNRFAEPLKTKKHILTGNYGWTLDISAGEEKETGPRSDDEEHDGSYYYSRPRPWKIKLECIEAPTPTVALARFVIYHRKVRETAIFGDEFVRAYLIENGSSIDLNFEASCENFDWDGHPFVYEIWLDLPSENCSNDDHSDEENQRKTKRPKLEIEKSDQLDDDSIFLKNRPSKTEMKTFNGVLGEDPDLIPFSDVRLIIVNERGEEIRKFFCHRERLATRSCVFYAMFSNKNWKEACDDDERKVEINDVDAETMEAVLRFIYLKEMPDKKDGSNEDRNAWMLKIVLAADKYKFNDLIRYCSAYLIANINDDQCRGEQLILADRLRLHQLKAVCVAALCANPEFSCFDDPMIAANPNLLLQFLKEMKRRQRDAVNWKVVPHYEKSDESGLIVTSYLDVV